MQVENKIRGKLVKQDIERRKCPLPQQKKRKKERKLPSLKTASYPFDIAKLQAFCLAFTGKICQTIPVHFAAFHFRPCPIFWCTTHFASEKLYQMGHHFKEE